MRFIHKSADEICEYVTDRELIVLRCANDGRSSEVVVLTSAIMEMLKQSETLWGLALPYYLSISSAQQPSCLDLSRAVSKIEAAADSRNFLLVAYQDGGLISVSSVLLPFQKDSDRADWWKPWT